MLKEFREFALRGNVIDLVVGFTVGAAFGGVAKSLVDDIIMPPIGLLLGKVNFASLFIALNGMRYSSIDAAKTAGAPTINYGLFVNTLVNFLIVAFVVFLLVKQVNRLMPKPEPAPGPVTKECAFCFTTIPIRALRCPNCTSELKP
jgi:large conductance mechanosensitive channel